MVGRHSQIIRRRRGDTLGLFAVHSHTSSRNKTVVGSSSALINTGASQAINETAKFRRTIGQTWVTSITPLIHLIVETVLTTSGTTAVHTVIDRIHDANYASLNVLTAVRLTTGNSLIQSIGTCRLKLSRHRHTGDAGFVCKPVNTVLAPALRHKRCATLRVSNSIIKECITDVQTTGCAKVATRGATRSTVWTIGERRICTHEGNASKRHQRGSSNGLPSTLELVTLVTHVISLSVVGGQDSHLGSTLSAMRSTLSR